MVITRQRVAEIRCEHVRQTGFALRLDLDEDEDSAVTGDDVDFAMPGAVAARKNCVPRRRNSRQARSSPCFPRRARSAAGTRRRTGKGRAGLFPLPARASRRVLEHDATGIKVLAQTIGLREVAPPSRGVPLVDKTSDLLHRDGGRRLFGPS